MSTTSLSAPIIQSFSRVETILSSCQALDSTARDLRRHILTIKAKFQSEVGLLSRGGVWGAGSSQSNPLVNEHLLESDIETSPDKFYPQFLNSMQTARTVLEEIVAILEERVRDSAERDRAVGILNLVAGPRIISILRFCWWVFMAMHGVLPMGCSEVLVFERLNLGGNSKPMLKGLLVRLGDEIEIISEVRQLVYGLTSPGPGPFADSTVRRLFPQKPPTTSEELNFEPPRVKGSLDDLHNLLSRELDCQCHFMHLCLDPSSAGPMDPVSICSFFVTFNPISMPGCAAQDHQCLTASRPPTPTPPPETSPAERSGGCSPITTLAEGSKHPLLVHQPRTQIAFFLTSAKPQAGALNLDTHLNPPPILTLRELLGPRPRGRAKAELGGRDRLLLAVKLAQWACQYNGTRWLYHLDSCNIRFFTQYESDLNYGNWTPYLSTFFNASLPARREQGGSYALGSVLLDLGLEKPLIGVPQNGEENIKLSIAIRKLLTGPGLRYALIVQELLWWRADGPIGCLGNVAKYIEETLAYLPE